MANKNQVKKQLSFDDYNLKKLNLTYKFGAHPKLAVIHQWASRFGYNPTKAQPLSEEFKKKLKLDNQNKSIKQPVLPAPVCCCCGLSIYKKRFSLLQHTYPSNVKKEQEKKQVQTVSLTVSSALFFSFIKVVIIYLFIRFFITDLYNSICNLFLGSNQSAFQNFMGMSMGLKSRVIDNRVLDSLNLLTVVLSIVYFTIIKLKFDQIEDQTDKANHTEDDYAIFVQKIPIFIKGKKKNQKFVFDLSNSLKQFFSQKLQGKLNKDSAIVRRVNLCFNLSEMQKINQKREFLMNKLKKLVNNDPLQFKKIQDMYESRKQNNDQQVSKQMTYIDQIQYLNYQQIQMSKQFINPNTQFYITHFVGKAFITFETQELRNQILKQYKQQPFLYGDSQLRISKAVEPSDVFWHNLSTSADQRFKKILYTTATITIFILFYCYVLIKLKQILRNADQQTTESATSSTMLSTNTPNISSNMSQIINSAISSIKSLKVSSSGITQIKSIQKIIQYIPKILITITTIVISFGIKFASQKLTDFQKHKTRTNYTISLLLKTITVHFLNIVLIFIIVIQNNGQDNNIKKSDYELYSMILSYISISGLSQIFFNVFPPYHCARYLYKKYKFGKEPVPIFQIQLNLWFENTPFNFQSRYSYYIAYVYVVCFYSYVCPPVSIILAFYFLIQYWVDKYNIFRRFLTPVEFNSNLVSFCFKSLQLSILIFTIGNLIFAYFIDQFNQVKQNNPFYLLQNNSKNSPRSYILNWISFSIALIYSILVIFLPEDKQTFNQKSIDETKFSQCISNNWIKKKYWTCNPATEFTVERQFGKQQTIKTKITDNIAVVQDQKCWSENVKTD